MIRHILTLLWNRRLSLAWIFIEQTLVFGVLLFCFTVDIDRIKRYHSKGTIRMDNIIGVGYMELENLRKSDEDNDAQFRSMVERMKEWPTVDLISISGYGAAPGGGGVRYDSISFNERRYRANVRYCDENYYRVFSPKLTEGQWFRDAAAYETPPALITQLLADNLGLTGSPIGQSVFYNGITYRITGVVEAFKERSSYEQLATMFVPVSTDPKPPQTYAIKYKEGQGVDFSKAFVAEFYKNFPSDQFQPAFLDFSKMLALTNLMEYSFRIYVLVIPTAFLLIFAFLGTFGLVWVQSKKRMSELGLRMALGCTPARLQRTIIIENLILTNFAMLPGLIVMANLYAFAPKGWEWIVAVGAAIVLMWLFAAFSAWYPAWKASRVQPVEALRQNQ